MNEFNFQGQVFNVINWNDVKCLKGFSGGFLIGIDHGYKSDVVAVYRLDKKLMTMQDICAEGIPFGSAILSIVFGRVNAKGVFKGSRGTANWLKAYGTPIYKFKKADLMKYWTKGEVNFGYALERYLCAKLGYTHGTEKQDRSQKIDVIGSDGKRWQVKCSICTPDSKNSFSSTNGSIYDE